MNINEQIDNALGMMASNIGQQQGPSKNDFLMSYLRGQPGPQTFAEGAGMPMQPPTVSMQQRPPRPPPASMQPPLPPPPQQQPMQPQGGPPPQQQQPRPGQFPQMQPPVQNPPSDQLREQYAALDKREQDLTAQMGKLSEAPDRSKSEAVYKERVAGGNQALLRALAAQQAGPGFAPLQQHFMQEAEAAKAPMKVAGGVYTPEGFIEDAEALVNKKLAVLGQQLQNIERAKNSNVTEQSRQQLKREEDKIRQEAQQLQLGYQRALAESAAADRRMFQQQAHLDRVAALEAKGGGGQGKILPTKTVTDLTEGQNKARGVARLQSEFKPEYAGAEGTAKEFAGRVVPFVDTQAAEWWKNYRKEAELIERHGLFGAALTATELASWRAADISPGMAPAAIERNLKRRAEVLQEHQDNYVRNLRTSGYNTEAFPEVTQPQTGSTGANWAPPPTGQAGPLKKARAAAQAASGGGGGGVVDFNALPKGNP